MLRDGRRRLHVKPPGAIEFTHDHETEPAGGPARDLYGGFGVAGAREWLSHKLGGPCLPMLLL